MRFIWFRLYGLDPESGTENHSLYLEWNYHSLIIEPNSRLFKLEEILDSKKSFWLHGSDTKRKSWILLIRRHPPTNPSTDHRGLGAECQVRGVLQYTQPLDTNTHSLLISTIRRVRASSRVWSEAIDHASRIATGISILWQGQSQFNRLGWVIFNSLETWMSHFQVSQDLDEVLEKKTASLSSSVDWCYSNLLDLLRVKTRVCSYNLYGTPFYLVVGYQVLLAKCSQSWSLTLT